MIGYAATGLPGQDTLGQITRRIKRATMWPLKKYVAPQRHLKSGPVGSVFCTGYFGYDGLFARIPT